MIKLLVSTHTLKVSGAPKDRRLEVWVGSPEFGLARLSPQGSVFIFAANSNEIDLVSEVVKAALPTFPDLALESHKEDGSRKSHVIDSGSEVVRGLLNKVGGTTAVTLTSERFLVVVSERSVAIGRDAELERLSGGSKSLDTYLAVREMWDGPRLWPTIVGSILRNEIGTDCALQVDRKFNEKYRPRLSTH